MSPIELGKLMPLLGLSTVTVLLTFTYVSLVGAIAWRSLSIPDGQAAGLGTSEETICRVRSEVKGFPAFVLLGTFSLTASNAVLLWVLIPAAL